jgi:hypothetical protein
VQGAIVDNASGRGEKMMEKPVERHTNGKKGKVPLAICFLLFTLFFVNLLIGKANITFQLGLPHLGNVAEFLLLAAASTLLIVAAIERESMANNQSNPKPMEEEK